MGAVSTMTGEELMACFNEMKAEADSQAEVEELARKACCCKVHHPPEPVLYVPKDGPPLYVGVQPEDFDFASGKDSLTELMAEPPREPWWKRLAKHLGGRP